MDFRVLGPLEVYDDDGAPLELAPRQRALLAYFLINRNEVLSTDRIIDAMWGEEPPTNALNSLRFHVNRLRAALEPDRARGAPSQRLPTRPPGYMLWVEPEELDAESAARMIRDARKQLESDDADSALAEFESALELWRGPALDEFTFEDWAQPAIADLTERHMEAYEGQAECFVALGDFRSAIPKLEELTNRHPGRERMWVLLMRSLAQAGRQAEATRAYDRAREALAASGLIPSDELQNALDRILSREERPRNRGNLPARMSRLVGRDHELERALGILADSRLITFTGPPGVGKTELALELARQTSRTAGKWYVALESVDDPAQISTAVLDNLEIVELPGRDPLEVLTDHIGELDFLLVLDNCEHLAGQLADMCGHLLTSCPELTIIATSTSNLGVDGEATFRVNGLPYADGIRSPAVELFLRRARSINADAQLSPKDMEAIALICSRLEGNPLAIGMAAARLTALGPQDIAERIADRFTLLVADERASPRRRSLRAAIEWSYDLLSLTDQETVRALATFRGGFTLDAARAVCDTTENTALNRLEHLIHATWVNSPVNRRFRMLETLRMYAAIEADASEEERSALRARHAEYYMALADQARRDLFGQDSATALATLSQENANCRTAVESLLEVGRSADALHLVVDLGNYWFESARYDQAQRTLRQVLDAVGDRPSLDSVQAWADLALHRLWAGREADDELATLVRHAEAIGDPVGLSRCHRAQATASWARGDYVGAYDELAASLDLLDDAHEALTAQPLSSLVRVAVWLGRYEAAEDYLGRLTELVLRRGTRGTRPLPQHCAAWLHLYRGKASAAIAAADEAIAGFSESGLLVWVHSTLLIKAMAALAADNEEMAFDAARRAREMSERFGRHTTMVDARSVLGRLAERRGDLPEACEHLTAAMQHVVDSKDDAGIMWATFHAAGFLSRHQHPAEAAMLHAKAQAIRDKRQLALTVLSIENYETELARIGDRIEAEELHDVMARGAELDHREALAIMTEACAAVAG